MSNKMKAKILLLVGTRKGLFSLSSTDRKRWKLEGPFQSGKEINHAVYDPRVGRISAIGVFRTDDGGATWAPRNKGTRAEFLPEKYPEFGQCVHKLLMAPGSALRLFQQNHCGVYRSDDAGETWQEITTGLPSDFGF